MFGCSVEWQSRRGFRGSRFLSRIDRAIANPLSEIIDDFLAKRSIRRHLQLGVVVSDGFDQEAFVRLAGDDRFSRVTTSPPSGPGVERQSAINLGLSRMALVTMLDQNGPNTPLEKCLTLGMNRIP